jgi:predicted RNA-binding Zn ribbon-like protein
VNLASFAELAVRLVNSATYNGHPDPLRSVEAFGDLVAGRPFLGGSATPHDLDSLKLLRDELAAVFAAAASDEGAEVAARLNALLVTHPLQPEIVNHDGDRWHLHLAEAGSVSDRFAAAAVAGLSMIVTQVGLHKIGVCSIASCDRVFVDGSNNRSRRYCTDHSAGRGTVTAIRREQDAAPLPSGGLNSAAG